MKGPGIKVVHISTSANGGAGIAAYCIHEALLKNNIESHFICLDTYDKQSLKSFSKIEKPKYSLIKSAQRKLLRLLTKYTGSLKMYPQYYFQTKLKKAYPLNISDRVSLPFSEYNILKHPAVINADVIHLHWVSDLLDYRSFFLNNKKPVVWTLHDMNPFQGIFHYKEDELRNDKISSTLNKYVHAIKLKAIKHRKCKLTIISPSQWLLKSATQNSIFKNVPGYNIPNTINTELFFPSRNKQLREKLNIPEENTIFLFVSQFVNSYRKGFDLLCEALAQLKSSKITLLVIGHTDDLLIKGIDIKILGSIHDNKTLRDYYSLADAFIIPSREDNLPNVLLEAMCCGTPVLSFNIGGMTEIIQDGFNGLKANKIDVRELVNVIKQFIKTKKEFSADAIHKFALQNFSNNIIAQKYIEVYKSLLN